jgi:hypothetical protein
MSGIITLEETVASYHHSQRIAGQDASRQISLTQHNFVHKRTRLFRNGQTQKETGNWAFVHRITVRRVLTVQSIDRGFGNSANI